MAAQRIAIVGAGPAGAALATLLVQRGAEVTLFDDGRRPELVVGESLVPALVPILRRLGVEDAVAALGMLKPGVSFLWSATDRFSFSFARYAHLQTGYAYNVPRKPFDEAILARAMAAGVRRVEARARLEPVDGNGEGPRVRIAAESLARAPWLGGDQPDMIVDATGRRRTLARLLNVPAEVGPRDDVAHFAHFEGFDWDAEEPAGQVLIARLAAGWGWAIPLRDRLSIGIVLGREDAQGLGSSPEDRLTAAIARDPALCRLTGAARRVTSVATYNNYQLISARAWGPGWVMVGDALGFVDPMLSPGVLLALRGAEQLADALTTSGDRERALEAYERTVRATLAAWMELVAHLYDGRLFALFRAGEDMMRQSNNVVTRAMSRHIERHLATMASGTATTAPYSRRLLRLLDRYGMRGVDPLPLAVR
jgi:flavin-dependent dehydrogenase